MPADRPRALGPPDGGTTPAGGAPADTTPAGRTPDDTTRDGPGRTVGRVLLGAALAFAGTGHLTFARQEFQAQVPGWVPLDPDVTVVASGVAEVALGAALVVAPRRWRPLVGAVVAAFFVAVFPGNVSQYLTGTDGFGLDSDAKRLARLPFQPVLVLWALWSTGAWRAFSARRRARR